MEIVSVVFPFHNEEDNIASLFQTLSPILRNIADCTFELLCINDGSRDGTLAALESARLGDPRILIIDFTRNFGKEAALTAGLDLATGDAVIFMDTDLQHPPELLPALIDKWRQGAAVVLAKRRSRATDSWSYRYLATAFYHIHNLISDIAIPVDTGDFRLIDRRVADDLKKLPESRRFLKGLFAWVGYDTEVVEYEVAPRVHGKSSYNRWRSWNFALEGITSFSTVPLRLWTYIGILMTGISFLYVAWIIVRALAFGIDVPGYVTVLSAVTFFGGLQLIGIGILGEYIGRIYMETKRRPIYLIRRVIR